MNPRGIAVPVAVVVVLAVLTVGPATGAVQSSDRVGSPAGEAVVPASATTAPTGGAVVPAGAGTAPAGEAVAPADAGTTARDAAVADTISSCTAIYDEGVHVLTGNITNGDPSGGLGVGCIEIFASNVTILGNGYTVDGSGQNVAGIFAGYDNDENVTVRNVTVTEWQSGVEFSGTIDALVANVTARSLSGSAIAGYGVTGEVRDLRVESVGGSAVANTNFEDELRILNVTASGLSRAVVSIDGETVNANATVRDVRATDAGGGGIDVRDAPNSVVENVTVDNVDGDAVLLENSSASAVRGIRATDVQFDGVVVEGSPDATVANVSVDGVGLGDCYDCDGLRVKNSPRTTVRDVRIAGAVSDVGIAVRSSDDFGLRNATIRNFTYGGIEIEDTRDLTVRNVSANVSAYGGGLVADGTRNLSIRNFRVDNTDAAGINIDDSWRVSIRNASVENTNQNGIELYDSRLVFLRDVNVVGVRTTGITLSNVSNSSISNTTSTEGDWAYTEEGSRNVTVTDLNVGTSLEAATTVDLNVTEARVGAVAAPPARSEVLPAPPDGQRSVFVYLEAQGLNVSGERPARLDVTTSYDEADAGNLDESTLSVWAYNRSTATWRDAGGTVDTGANVATGAVAPGGVGTVLALLGSATDAEPTYENLTVDPNEVPRGGEVVSGVTVNNTGGRQLESLSLTVNDRAVRSRTVLLAGGDTRDVTYAREFFKPSNQRVSFAGVNDSELVYVGEDNRTVEWRSWHRMTDNDNFDFSIYAPRQPVRTLWNADLPSASSCCIPMKPVVVNDTVFVFSYVEAWARDARTGELLWNNSNVSGTYLGGIAVQDGRVFVSAGSDGLYALNATTGKKIWNRSDFSTYDSAPVVLNGTVFIGSYGETMYALDPATGATEWNRSFDNLHLYNSPTATNGTVYVTNGSNVTALDASDGSLLWHRFVGYSESTPAVEDGILYVADAGVSPFLHALDARTGEFVWNATAGYTYTGVAVAENTVVVSTCGDTTYAYNADTGAQRWNTTRGTVACAYDVSEPVVVEDTVFLTDYNRETVAVDLDTGAVSYTFNNPTCCKYTSPTPYRGVLYVADRYDSGGLSAIGGVERPLLDPDTAVAGGNTTLTVRKEYREEVVPNATLTVEATGDTLAVGSDGLANYTFPAPGTYAVTITAPNTTIHRYVETTRYVEVLAPANFSVNITGTNEPVPPGEDAVVNATVENVGGLNGTQTVNFTVDGSLVANRTVSLNASETTNVTFTTATSSDDVPGITVGVASENDTATTNVTVANLANFSVTVTGTNEPVSPGEDAVVNATVENVGNLNGTQTVNFTVDGSLVANRTVSLNGSESTNLTFTNATSSDDVPGITVGVASENDTATTNVTVATPANFSVNVTGTNSPVTAGNTLDVTANVTNVGGLAGAGNVTLAIDGVVRDNVSVTLGPGNSTTVVLNWPTTASDVGPHNATVTTANDSVTTTIAVESGDESGRSDDDCRGDGRHGDNANDGAENGGCGEEDR